MSRPGFEQGASKKEAQSIVAIPDCKLITYMNKVLNINSHNVFGFYF